MKRISILLVVYLSACNSIETIDFSEESDNTTDQNTSSSDINTIQFDKVCGGPYYEIIYPKLSTWANSDCLGDFARGALDQYPCAVWSNGKMYCVDIDQPIDKIYYHNSNNNGKCEEWTLYPEQWYIWKYCGNKPLP